MDVARFDVEVFDWTAADRLTVTGRWSGVRGVLFVRPTLVLIAGDRHRRLLASLDGKPWPAEEGRSWTAVFPWDGERLEAEAAELSVAPGVLVRLPPPGPEGEGAVARGSTDRRGILQRAAETARLERELTDERAAREAAERERDALLREAGALRRERDLLRRDRERLTVERDAALRERDAAAVTRDRLARERERLMAQRDELRRGAG